MSETPERIEIYRGLKGVYFDRSRVCYIDGREGELRYRGYSIHDLAQRSNFEETMYLLLKGELPTRLQLADFTEELMSARKLPEPLYELIRTVKNAHPMDVLRTGVSALSAFDPETADKSPDATLRKGVRLTAQVPLIVAAHEMDIDMVLHAEHGSNASSFAARVVAGTDADLHGAITAAVAALSGPAHGGAAENVMRMAQEIGDASKAAEYVKTKRANKQPVMGFGHRVYRAEDPRARHMRAGVEKLSREMGQPHWYQILEAVVEAMKPYARHGVNVNVDFYAGVVYFLNGIAEDLFVPIFAVGRVPGWTVQVLEQLENNILLRPLTLYNGPEPRDYVPIEKR